MTRTFPGVNATIAPLTNVSLFSELVDRLINRPGHLPGLAVFQGHSGLGKTFASTYAANVHKAIHLEVGESWTRRFFLQKLLGELDQEPKGPIAALIEQATQALLVDTRPIIIDEFDHVVKRKYHETIRELHDATGAPIILIGEENLAANLKNFERFHNRVMDWVYAEHADATDAHHLAKLYCGDIEITDDLLEIITAASNGRVRRICTNLEQVKTFAKATGRGVVTAADWGKRKLFTGMAPTRKQTLHAVQGAA